MRLTLSTMTPRKKNRFFADALEDFTTRLAHYATMEQNLIADESAFHKLIAKTAGGTARLVLLDSRGAAMSSEQLAAWIGRERDGGTAHLHFAIGPADGWSNEMRGKADLLLAFGPMTFPHELAQVMLAEQIYRAFTILAGHPYHAGH